MYHHVLIFYSKQKQTKCNIPVGGTYFDGHTWALFKRLLFNLKSTRSSTFVALLCLVLLCFVSVCASWVEMICMTILEWRATHTIQWGGLVHAVEGERDHKVWSLTSIVHTHTYILHSLIPWPPMLSFDSVCRCVSERRTTPSVCEMHPATIHPHTPTHTHTHTNLFFSFSFPTRRPTS